MRPESFARWSPGVKRQEATFIVRPGIQSDVEPSLQLLAAIGVGDEAAWRQTLTRTVLDGEHRVLFVAEMRGQIVGYGRAVLTKEEPDVPNAAPVGWYLLGLVVGESWRQHGIGESLTRADSVGRRTFRSSVLLHSLGKPRLTSASSATRVRKDDRQRKCSLTRIRASGGFSLASGPFGG